MSTERIFRENINGIKCVYKGILHSYNDKPAKIDKYGTKTWYKEGIYHRENGPALVKSEFEVWYLNGKMHRANGPAYTNKLGTQEWYIHGKRHREDGPAVIKANGDKEWWLNGERQPDP